MKKLLTAITVCLFTLFSYGQDSLKTLSLDKYLWFVTNYHPLAQQAELLIPTGESTVRQARGGFDPKLFSYVDQKQFEDKNYYNLQNSGLTIPTWYGIEVKTGLERNSGAYLNPENSVPNSGLWYGGISVPLGQGLVIDKRRAALQQAKLYARSTEVERQKLLNDLYFEAIKQYWNWLEAWNQLQVFEETLVLAETRFKAVKQSHKFGDLPAIDTLESFIQLQNRQMNRNQAELYFKNSTLALSNYLWFENNTPLEVPSDMQPPVFNVINEVQIWTPDTFMNVLNTIDTLHPEMKLYDYKLGMIAIDRSLKAEYLKPKLNLNYNVINEPVNNDALAGVSAQNYKWGMEFSFPVLLREQRGDLQLTDIKIQETQLSREQKLLELTNKVKQYYNELLTLNSQINLYTDAVVNYRRMLEGEKQKFELGESSLFLINSRELYLIEAELKLIELRTKYYKAHAGLMWASGLLATLY